MRFSSAVPIIIAGFSALAAAAGENAFIVPMSGFNPEAGKDSTIQWDPTAGKTVTLKLRQGASSNLGTGTTIAAKIPNDGSYTWNVPADVVRGTDYTIQIVNDDNTSQTNYYPYFTIQSTNVVAVSSSAASSSAPSSSTESGSKTSASKTSAKDASVTALDVSSSASASASAKSASATKSGASSASGTASSSSATEKNSSATSSQGSAPTSGASAVARGGIAAFVLAAAGFAAATW